MTKVSFIEVLNISDHSEAGSPIIRLSIAGAFATAMVTGDTYTEDPHNATVTLARSSDGHVIEEFNYVLLTDKDVVKSSEMVEYTNKIQLPSQG